MLYGYARRPEDAVIPDATPVDSFAPIPGDQVPRVSRVGPLLRFLPLIFQRMVDVASLRGVREPLLAGEFDVLDAETTGGSRSKNVMWQLAAVKFRGFIPVDRLSRVIAISREDYDNAFLGRPDREEIMDKIHLSWERIEAEGCPAREVMDEFDEFIRGRDGIPMLGYHTRSIDLPFTQILWSQIYPGREVFLPMHRLIDVGAVIKAAQLEKGILPGETADEFVARINGNFAAKIYWSVQYVTEQFSLGLDSDSLHDALQDCEVLGMIWDFIAHQGMTEQRKKQWQDQLLGNNSNEMLGSTSGP